jgi:hypothetical protein
VTRAPRSVQLARVNADFRAASKTLEEVRLLLAKNGGTLGADLSGNISKLPDLARRFNMAIGAENLLHEKSTEGRESAEKRKEAIIQRVDWLSHHFFGEKTITRRRSFLSNFYAAGQSRPKR